MHNGGGDMEEAKGRWPDCGPHLKLVIFCKYDDERQMEVADLEGNRLQFTHRKMNLTPEFCKKKKKKKTVFHFELSISKAPSLFHSILTN